MITILALGFWFLGYITRIIVEVLEELDIDE